MVEPTSVVYNTVQAATYVRSSITRSFKIQGGPLRCDTVLRSKMEHENFVKLTSTM
jgi:hypothetical protein